ncbi:MAG: 2,3-diketo-5-methylthiopentyl-1-phosphate enolase [Deinococcus sp.]|nr:2,3-diketo-5-methylthiopentyl-1-phosphate enolase [Deinococcus sp.]
MQIVARYRMWGVPGSPEKTGVLLARLQAGAPPAPGGAEVQAVAVEGDTVVASIAYPLAWVEPRVTSLLIMTMSEVGHLPVRLEALELPEAFARKFPGPKLGVEGLRQRLGVWGRPLVMGILKGCLGWELKAVAQRFAELARGGCDLIKDDEVMADEPPGTVLRRLEACHSAAEQVCRETGRTVLYCSNLTGPPSTLLERAHQMVQEGAGGFFFNVVLYGYGLLQDLAADEAIDVPLVLHPGFLSLLSRGERSGIAPALLVGTLSRLAGGDVVIFPGPRGSFPWPQETGAAIHGALQQTAVHRRAWSAPAGGLRASMLPELLVVYGHDLVVNAGTAISTHPDGPQAGAQALAVATAVLAAGGALADAAQQHPVLRRALEDGG